MTGAGKRWVAPVLFSGDLCIFFDRNIEGGLKEMKEWQI